jgi:hypothetical protein
MAIQRSAELDRIVQALDMDGLANFIIKTDKKTLKQLSKSKLYPEWVKKALRQAAKLSFAFKLDDLRAVYILQASGALIHLQQLVLSISNPAPLILWSEGRLIFPFYFFTTKRMKLKILFFL